MSDERDRSSVGNRAGRRPPQKRRPRVSDDAVAEEILRQVDAAGETGRVRPEDVARAILSTDWQGLLKRIRRQAIHFAHDGRVIILRKGQPADPDDFRGVYRLRVGPRGAWPEDEADEVDAPEAADAGAADAADGVDAGDADSVDGAVEGGADETTEDSA